MKSSTPGIGFAVSLGAITLIAPLSIHLFLPAIPTVQAAFGVSGALVQLTFSVTMFTMAVVTPVYGTLSDRLGRRPVLLIGLGMFLLGSLVAALAPTIAMLILGRMVQAAGAGCGLTLTRAMARDAYGPEGLVKAIAYLTIAYTLGPMLAPPFGGLLIDTFGWRSIFWFALLVGTAITVASVGVLYETRSPADHANQPASLVSLYGALLRDRSFLAFILQSGFMSFAFFGLASASPFLSTGVLAHSATEYGLLFMLMPLAYCCGNIISSRLSGRVSVERMVLIGSLLCFAAMVVQAGVILTGPLSALIIFAPGAVMTFSQGLALPNAQAGAIRVNPGLAGTAAGLGVFIQLLLSAVSAQLYGFLADGTARPMILLTLCGSALAVTAALSLFVPKGRTQASGRTPPTR